MYTRQCTVLYSQLSNFSKPDANVRRSANAAVADSWEERWVIYQAYCERVGEVAYMNAYICTTERTFSPVPRWPQRCLRAIVLETLTAIGEYTASTYQQLCNVRIRETQKSLGLLTEKHIRYKYTRYTRDTFKRWASTRVLFLARSE